jgi:hypothetical protein
VSVHDGILLLSLRLCAGDTPAKSVIGLTRYNEISGEFAFPRKILLRDVGDASHAAVPHIVAIHRKRGVVDWNTYAIVACIETARTERKNPKVPEWLEKDYFRSIGEVAEIGIAEISRTDEPEAVRAILSIVAITKGLRTHGRFLVDYAEDELLDMESRL